MRFTAVFPFFCAVASFTLVLLCVFAGSKRGYMEDAHILTLNTSQLGRNIHIPSGGSSNAFVNSIINGVSNVAGGIANTVAKEIGVHDFYSAHMMDFCEGYYKNGTSKASGKNVTACSPAKGMYSFNPRTILQTELVPGVSLNDLNWPQEIDTGLKALSVVSKVMFVLYMIGTAAAGLMILTSIGGFTGSRIWSFVNFGLGLVAFIALGIASGCATAVAVKATDLLNQYGNKIGVAAYYGAKFLAMTWSATALMLVASIAWTVEFCMGRKRRASYGARDKIERY